MGELMPKADYIKYPFAYPPIELQKLYEHIGGKPGIIVEKDNELKEKLKRVLKNVFEKSEIPIELFKNEKESVIIYNTLIDVISLINDKKAINKLALAYSKTASKFLSSEKDDNVLVYVGNMLGLHVEIENKPPRLPVVTIHERKGSIEFRLCSYTIPVEEYVKIAASRLSHDPSYILINNFVQGGKVYLDKHTYLRVLEEYIFQTIISICSRSKQPLEEEYMKLLDEVKETLPLAYTIKASQESISESAQGAFIITALFPPCIKKIIDELRSGSNPSHLERFTLAAFLARIGMSIDDMLEYFKLAPDYQERIARYQLEHIAGLRGGRKQYLPPNCNSLKSSGVCPITTQCPGGKSPLGVYRYNLRTMSKEKKPPAGFEPASTGSLDGS